MNARTSPDSPQVTVLMPVYNPGAYLDAAIESILEQTFSDFELLIVNDGSDASTTQSLVRWASRDRRIRLLHHAENRGITPALNTGLAAARGELLARQDADDIALPERLQAQVAFLDRHPEHVLVGTDCVRIDARGRDRVIDSAGWREWELDLIALVRTPLVHSTAMFRMHPIRRLGMRYAERYTSAEDYDLWVQLRAVGRIAVVPRVLVRYREHTGAISSRRGVEQHRNMHAIALRHCLARLPALAPDRDAVTCFYDLFYLHQRPTPATVGRASAGLAAIGTAFAEENRLDPAGRCLVRRLCARWLAMGLLRSGALQNPTALLPLLRQARSLGPPMAAELVDFIGRRMRARWPRWRRPRRAGRWRLS